ncbi:MAG TPA: M20/M25/M40 family metallo-hydrolase [Verrucomicrobiota bacterium]|nr:M20/M25/M40 family metallo-hydrolase [Verrucomicrobiota bacterium]HNU49492.1 M20/M25/M40 family metallo-hydrolase [Verrucomicrobiota bacterium]
MHRSASLLDQLDRRLPATLDFLREMVGINSYTGNPTGVNRVGELTAAAFAPLGFQAEFVQANHPQWGRHLVLTRQGATDRSIAMVSHLDTVFPPEEEERNDFRWRQEGDRIYGPGTHDIKGGTALMRLVLETLRDQFPTAYDAVTWRLFLNAAEETFSPDFGDLCRARLGAGSLGALVFEAEGRAHTASTTPRLVVARKGRAAWCVRVDGRAAHAGGNHAQGANAIVQLAETVRRIASLTDYSKALTFNVGRVTGGSTLNRVPHEALAEGEFRAFTPETFAAGRSALMSLAGQGDVRSPADGHACRVAIEIVSESRPWPRNPGTDRLLGLWQQAGADLGITVEPEERGGLSDGNLLWDHLPTIDGLGPYGEHDHCSERSADGSKTPEYVLASSFVPKAALNVMGILRLIP